MQKTLRAISISLLLVAILLPLFPVSAKDDQRNEKKETKKVKIIKVKDDKRDADDKNANAWAWGRFFAPGWQMKNGRYTFDFDAWLSWWKRARRATSTGTTTPDTIAPIISHLRVVPAVTRANVQFTTNKKADAVMYLSTTTPVSTSSPAVSVSERLTDHDIVLGNLSPTTTYFLIVKSRDAAGNVTYSDTISFTTNARALPADNFAPKLNNVYAIVGTSSATVNWITNEPASSRIYVSTLLPVDLNASTTRAIENLTLVSNHSLVFDSLATSTKYYFVLQSKDAAGNSKNSVTYYLVTP